ncbi:hypothetical protein ACS2Q0_34675 [Bacillus cereus group sp. Bce010]
MNNPYSGVAHQATRVQYVKSKHRWSLGNTNTGSSTLDDCT